MGYAIAADTTPLTVLETKLGWRTVYEVEGNAAAVEAYVQRFQKEWGWGYAPEVINRAEDGTTATLQRYSSCD